MKKLLKYLLGLVIVIVISATFLFLYIYNNLDVKEKPAKSDVIVYLDGGDISRFDKTVELYKKGFAKKIIVTQTIEKKDYNNIQIFKDKGIPEKDLIKDYKATSTWTNAVNSVKIMKEHNFKSALVVTNDFHGQRSKLAFKRAIGSNEISYKVITTPDNKGKNYKDSKMFEKTVKREIFVLPAYWLGLYKIFDL